MKTYKLEQKDGVGRGGIVGWKCVVQSLQISFTKQQEIYVVRHVRTPQTFVVNVQQKLLYLLLLILKSNDMTLVMNIQANELT